jgi:hypothetical protein
MQFSVLEREGHANHPGRTISNRRAAMWLAGFALLCFVYFLPRWNSYNEEARLDVTLSLVDHLSIDINPYHLNTGDETHVGKNYFSNKAVGQSLAGVPAYALFKAIVAIPAVRSIVNDVESDTAWHYALADAACPPPPGSRDHCRFVTNPKLDFALVQYFEAIMTVAIPSTLMLLLFFWFLGFLSTSLLDRILVTAGLGLGTVIFPYSQLFFSHVPATALDFLGFVLVYCASEAYSPHAGHERIPRWLTRDPRLTMALAGLALGLSVVFEYPAVIVMLMVGVYALTQVPRKLVAWMILGALPGLLIIMSYNFAAYHDPFTTGYGCNEVKWRDECQGIAGFTWPPSGQPIRDLSVGVYRGLLFMSPFLALAFPGYWLWYIRVRRHAAAAITCFSIPVVFFFAICMYVGWNGGQVAGPRYLMELVPFLAVPVIFVFDAIKGVWGRIGLYALLTISFANTWIETVGGRAFPRGPQLDPLFAYNLPQLGDGHLPMSLGTLIGLGRGPISVIPLAVLLALWTGSSIVGARLPARKTVRIPPDAR